MFDNAGERRKKSSWSMRVATALLLATSCFGHAAAEEYKVAAGDVLSISVYGDTGLTGTFPVSVDGTIGYPMLGNIDVADKTTDEIGGAISAALAARIANPSVAVTVKEYAPVFIVGDVQKPGKYEFRPGMTILELFALGGGLREATNRTDTSGVELIATQREYEDMSLQLLAQDVKRSRLEAELNDKPFAYKPQDNLLPKDAAAIEQIVQSEDALFKLRLNAMQDEQTNLESQRQNYMSEIDTLQKTGALRNQQFDLLSLDVDASQELVAKGAASQAALRDRKRELLAMNQQLLEFGSYLARAQQNKNEVERRILDLKTKRHSDAATELREIDIDMIRLKKKMSYSLQTMAEIGSSAKKVAAFDALIKTEYSIVHQSDGQYQEASADERTRVQAGDVVRVTLVPPSAARADAKRVADLN
jgi:polysaccharide biosynthesis/export protein